MTALIPPWIVRDGAQRELARGGDWSSDLPRLVLAPSPCSAPKPHVDANGDRDGWRICGAEVERTRDGSPTGRCRSCREREAMRRQDRAAEAKMVANGGAMPFRRGAT